MKRLRLYFFLSWIGLTASLPAAESKRVAVLDFVRGDAPVGLDPALLDFSRAVQARLLTDQSWDWVERQEFNRLMQEADPGGARGFDAASAVRLGHLAQADLLLRGAIRPGPGPGAELTIEVIDLRRAEALAVRSVPVTMNARQKLHPIAAEITASANAATAVLAEVRKLSAQTERQRVMAPLYFRNTSKGDRLGFLEERLQTALTQAVSATPGWRTLRFSRPAEAGEESSLVLAGLTDTDPDAWQKVADCYVWGSFEEEPVNGAVFDDVPVTIVLQVSNGIAEPRLVRWEGSVKELSAGLATVSTQVVEAAQAIMAEPIPAGTDQRQRLARSLQSQQQTIGKRVAQGGAEFAGSATGKQLFAYQLKLLEVASFFDPLNRPLQEKRLALAWGAQNPFKPLETLQGQWLRVADYDVQSKRFARLPDGSLDPQWSAAQERNLREFSDRLENSTWKAKSLAISLEEIHRQQRAIVGQWAELLAATDRAVQQEATPPSWYATQRKEWFKQADFLHRVADPIIRHAALEKAWPALAPEMGLLLKNTTPAAQQQTERWIAELFSVYGAMGDHDRATAMLDTAWQLGAARPGSSAAGDKPRVPPPRQQDQAWTARALPTPPAPDAAGILALEATIREVDPRNLRQLDWGEPITEEVVRKNINARIEALAWWAGKLWISEAEELPAALGPKNPQGNHYLWGYDPALRTAELITPKLGGHSTVAALLPVKGNLWMGFAADGAKRLDDTGAVRSYRGEDGLQTMQIDDAASDGQDVFYLGGPLFDQLISSYSLKDQKWSGLQVPLPEPMPDWLTKYRSGGNLQQSYRLAVSGEWLCFTGAWTAFYHRPTKRWVDLQLQPGPAGSFRGQYADLSADDSGFWLASGGFNSTGLSFVDPAKPEEKQFIRLPNGILRAMAHDGPRLWVLLEGLGARSQLLLVDKKTRSCTGQVTLPMEKVTCLAAGDGRVWVGAQKQPLKTGGWDDGLALVEVTGAWAAGETDPAPATDFPLLRAVWRGEEAAVAQLLAAKADPNAAGTSGWTALMSAAAAGRTDLMSRLLEAKADPNRIAREGETALQQAVARGNLTAVRLLLQHGAKPNLPAPGKLRGFSQPIRPQLARQANQPSSPPTPPAKVKAASTAEGEVVLTWEDRADNEDYYEVRPRNHAGGGAAVYRLAPDSNRWIDPHARDDAQLSYTVEAINELSQPAESQAVVVGLARPTPGAALFYSRYGHGETLPTRLLAQGPLATAAGAGRQDLVELLLGAGADPNLPDAMDYTPLLQAVRHRHYAVARRLLAAGARADWLAATGESAALLAYRWHEDEALLGELLLAMPAPFREQEATILISEAAERGQIKDCEKLQALGGDYGSRITAGSTPLLRALARDQLATAQWLLARQAPELGARFRSGKLRAPDEAMIRVAVQNNRPEFFARLLEVGLSPDQYLADKPLVVIAAGQKAFAVLTLLRDRGANLSQRGTSTDLDVRGDGSVASQLTPEEARRYLGAAQPQAGTKTWPLPDHQMMLLPGPAQFEWPSNPAKLGLNAKLMAACHQGNLPAVVQAVAAGAELDARGEEGRTPLLEALKVGAFPVARWLVEEGVSVNRSSQAGFSPLTFAVGAGRPAEVDYLLQAGADPNLYGHGGMPPLMLAAQAGNLGLMRQLLAAGANPNVSAPVRSRRENALALALSKGNAAAVDLLLAAGANPRGQTYHYTGNTTAKGGVTRTPQPSLLMFAASGRNLALVKQMISLGHDPRLQTDGGYDALSWAAHSGARDVVEFLLPLSAKQGHALSMALENGHPEIAELLRDAGYRP